MPEALAAVVEKMMARDPAQRYATMAAVVEALAPWAQTPIPPPPAEEMPQLCRAARGDVLSEAAFSPLHTPTSLRADWPQPTERPVSDTPLMAANEADGGLAPGEVEVSDPDRPIVLDEQGAPQETTETRKTDSSDADGEPPLNKPNSQTATTEVFEEDLQPADSLVSTTFDLTYVEGKGKGGGVQSDPPGRDTKPESDLSMENLFPDSDTDIPPPDNKAKLAPTPSLFRQLPSRKTIIRTSEQRGLRWGMVAAVAGVLLLILIVVFMVRELSDNKDEESTDERSVPELLEALKDTDPVMRTGAVYALGQHFSEAATVVPVLIEVLKDKDKNVRLTAIGALGTLGPVAKSSLPALKRLLKDRDEEIREAVEEAVEQIEHS
jgi:hypothetical protein